MIQRASEILKENNGIAYSKFDKIKALVFKPKIDFFKAEKVFEILRNLDIDKRIMYPTVKEIENSNLLDLSKIKIGIYSNSIYAQFGKQEVFKTGMDKEEITDLININ